MRVERQLCSVVVLAVLLGGAPARARSRPKARPTGSQARVVYVAGGKAYIDRGGEHGLAAGMVVGGGKKQCVLAAVADAWAVCPAGGLRLGDALPMPAATAPAQVAAQVLRAETVSEASRQAAVTQLAAAPVMLVAYDGPAAKGSSRIGGEAAFAHDVWAQGDLGSRGFQRERVDIGVDARNVGVVGLSVHARLTAMHWTSRPAIPRFRPDTDTQLYVWQGEVDYRPGSGPAVAAGRLRPWALPGIAILDGAQLGYTNAASRLEVGIYGGGVPNTVTLAPRSDAWALGAYATRDFRLAPGLIVAATVRGGALQTAAGGMLATFGSELMAQLGRRASGGAMLVASADADQLAKAHVDFWSAQLEVRPVAALSAFVQGRGETHAYYALADGTSRDTAMRLHTDAALTWSALAWLALGATGGTTTDDGWSRGYVGPEVRLQQILPLAGSASLGYFKELGDLAAHTVYAQVSARPLPRLSLWTRGTYTVSDERDLRNEAGLSLAASGAMTSWLSAGTSVMTTYGNLDGQGTQTLGILARLWASGRF